MKYVVLTPDSTVAYTFPEIDPVRPDIPVTALYAADFLRECIQITDDIEVRPGMTWTGTAFIETNQPAQAITLDDYRAQAKARLDGRCSGAIYGGTVVACSTGRGKKHYIFTEEAQRAIALMAQGVLLGETHFSYKADTEEYNEYTADEVKSLFSAMGQWITICTKYKETLEKWIGQETDTAILQTIQYGSALPDALQTELIGYLSALNIAVADLLPLLS